MAPLVPFRKPSRVAEATIPPPLPREVQQELHITKEVLLPWKEEKEEDFHDEWADSIDPHAVLVDESFECCTAPECRQIMQWLGDISGKKVLDVGCGAGEGAVYFAKKGADVTASDISAGMLEVTKKVAEAHGVAVKTKQLSAERLPFGNETFDVVYAGNILHHVDLTTTLREIRRVLKPGGVFVSWDPLAHNPLINIYRRIASNVRTPDEQPVKISDIDTFKKFFSSVQYECFWFFTLWIFIKFALFERVDPNKERYWKKIISEHRRLRRVYKPLEALDRLFLRILPYFRKHCWNVVVCAKK